MNFKQVSYYKITNIFFLFLFFSGFKSLWAAEIVADFDSSCAIVDERVTCWGDSFSRICETCKSLQERAGRGRYSHLCHNPSVNIDGNLCFLDHDVQLPYLVPNLEKVWTISSGIRVKCAISDQGELKCWGNNQFGELGDGTFDDHIVPVTVVGMERDVKAVALSKMPYRGPYQNLLPFETTPFGFRQRYQMASELGMKSVLAYDTYQDSPGRGTPSDVNVRYSTKTDMRSYAIMTDGELMYWPKSDSILTPDVVESLRGIVVHSVSVGERHVCVVLEGGSVRCWGANEKGQLGDNSTDPSEAEPVQVLRLKGGIKEVALGSNHSCVLSEAGGVMCWGENNHGQLGDSTTVNRLRPVQVVGLESGVMKISSGYNHNCVILEGGSVKCWGENLWGQIGNETTQDALTPASVQSLHSGVTDVSAGFQHTCAIVSGGIKCWGVNTHYQLGDVSMKEHRDTIQDQFHLRAHAQERPNHHRSIFDPNSKYDHMQRCDKVSELRRVRNGILDETKEKFRQNPMIYRRLAPVSVTEMENVYSWDIQWSHAVRERFKFWRNGNAALR